MLGAAVDNIKGGLGNSFAKIAHIQCHPCSLQRVNTVATQTLVDVPPKPYADARRGYFDVAMWTDALGGLSFIRRRSRPAGYLLRPPTWPNGAAYRAGRRQLQS
jgi:hypothetical protein